MKTSILFMVGFSAAAASFALGGEKAAEDQDHRVAVTFAHPDKFTDFTTSGFGSASDKDLKYLTEIFTKHIERTVKPLLGPDDRLEIIFKDIDLAGRFEPERGPSLQNVRVYRDTSIPRMVLDFRLLAADGTVRAEGVRKLSDMNYTMNLQMPAIDPEFRHDKALLTDWLNAEIKKKKG